MNRLSLKIKIAMVVSLLFIMFGAASALFAIVHMEREFRESIACQQSSLASFIAENLDEKLALAQKALVAASANLPAALRANQGDAKKFIDERVTLQTIFDNSIFLFDGSGRMIAERPRTSKIEGGNFAFRDYFLQTVATRKPLISSPFISRQLHHEPAIMLAAPVFDDRGRLIYILCGSFRLRGKTLLHDLPKMNIGKSGYLTLTTSDRITMMHPDPAKIMKIYADPGKDRLFDQAVNGFSGTAQTTGSSDVSMLTSFSLLKNVNWILGVHNPVDEAYEIMYTTRKYLAAGFAAGTVGMLLITWLVMLKMTSPLMKMTQEVEAMRSGPLHQVAALSSDEIGTLAAAFNRLIDTVHVQLSQQRAIINNIPDMAWLKDTEGKYITANEQFSSVSGVALDDLIGGLDADLWPPDMAKKYREDDVEIIKTRARKYFEEYVVGRNGKKFYMETVKTPIFNARNEVIGIIGIAHDITARKQEELQLRYASTHDTLTGLYNRAFFDQELERLAHGRKVPVSIIMADVNDLKRVNDTCGHAAGDRLLRTAAQAIMEAFRAEDIVARIGGDEFGVLLPETGAAAAEEAALRIADNLAAANRHETEFRIDVALGVATAEHGDELPRALRSSDERMYLNKAAKKASLVLEATSIQHVDAC